MNMSSTLLLPQRAQLCNRSCSNKTHVHTHVLGTHICGAWFGFGSGFGIGFTLTLFLARAPLLLATLLSHTIPFPCVH
jgi:hypothetical protein